MDFPESRLLVFAKAPEPGAVKSRLIASLGAEGAADLYSKMAHHCIQQVCAMELCPVELWCSPSKSHRFFAQCANDYPVSLYDQCQGDLGTRMAYGLRCSMERGSSAVVIGADCPSITPGDLRQCLQWLRDDVDVVIGPAEDSGYYLIGMRKLVKELFTDIPWGGPRVLPLTRQRLDLLGIRFRELATRWDVDRPEDVRRLEQLGVLAR